MGQFWMSVIAQLNGDPKWSYNSRKNATTIEERAGLRSLKNFNNLVKTLLIDWALSSILQSAEGLSAGGTPPCFEVLDVASGRGGDQMKYLRTASNLGGRLCYNGVDVAEEQVQEAHRRLLLALKQGGNGIFPDEAFGSACARLFVGDMLRVSLPRLPWQQ